MSASWRAVMAKKKQEGVLLMVHPRRNTPHRRGEYVFEFDNRFSMLTAKDVELTYCFR